MNKRSVLFSLVLALLCGCVFANEADKYLSKDRLKYFSKYLSNIHECHLISNDGLNNLGTTWEEELHKAKRRFINAESRNDVYYALLSLQRSLHDSHSKLKIQRNFLPSAGKVALPLKFRAEYNNGNVEYVVIETTDNNIPIGSILLSVDGRTIDRVESDFVEWVIGNSKDYLIEQTAKRLPIRDPKYSPSPLAGTKTIYTFKTPDSKILEAKLKWTEIKEMNEPYPSNNNDYKGYKAEFAGLNYIVYPTNKPDLKIVRYFSFYYKFNNNADLWNRFSSLSYKPRHIDTNYSWNELETIDQDELFNYLNRKRVTKIILDVRENGGGSFNPDFIGRFTNKPFNAFTRQLTYLPIFKKHPEQLNNVDSGSDFMRKDALEHLIKDPTAKLSPMYPYECVTDACKKEEAIYNPKNNKIIKLTVLSGPECTSSCAHFVAIVNDNDIGEVVGLPSQGGDAPFRYDTDFVLADKSHFNITTSAGVTYRLNGFPLEAHPADVDLVIHPTSQNRGDYLKDVLNKIERKGQP